jgi:hypothetical protein
LGAWLAEPILEKQVALTITSSLPHSAGFDATPSADPRTTRN